jgi:hypothetical protein
MAQTNLTNAKKAKNDEFYTQYADIEREMNAYLDYDKDVFRDKTILLPCDDPEWSNFARYFSQNFQSFGLKKLISTSYAIDSKPDGLVLQPRDEEIRHLKYDSSKARTHGRVFTLTRDMTGDDRINFQDLEWEYLEGDGDFRSAEVTALRDEADIIITNPPFSLFREFLSWIFAADKRFVIIGNMNAITYKEVFPLIKDNKIWLGNGFAAGNAYFASPTTREYAVGVADASTGLVKFRNVTWFTNLDHGRRHEPLALMTEADNIKFSKRKEIKGVGYQKYDNYDAIEVPFTDAIPSDYPGIMGVPISFLNKYNPDQFEIVGSDAYDGSPPIKRYPNKEKVVDGVRMKSITGAMGCVIRQSSFGSGTYFDVGYPVQAVYKRIFIRHRGAA